MSNQQKGNKTRQDTPPSDVIPRYQWMGYWTPRSLRKGRKR